MTLLKMVSQTSFSTKILRDHCYGILQGVEKFGVQFWIHHRQVGAGWGSVGGKLLGENPDPTGFLLRTNQGYQTSPREWWRVRHLLRYRRWGTFAKLTAGFLLKLYFIRRSTGEPERRLRSLKFGQAKNLCQYSSNGSSQWRREKKKKKKTG